MNLESRTKIIDMMTGFSGFTGFRSEGRARIARGKSAGMFEAAEGHT
jgi:hypothetical protein